MSRLPSAAASRNMSACRAHAMSHVGCRLMVASSANINRPRAPEAWGDIARALATKAAMSSEADGFTSGNGAAFPDAAFCCAESASLADFGLVGSPDMRARNCCTLYVGRDRGTVNATDKRYASVPDRLIEGDRPRRLDDLQGVGLDRPERAVVVEKFIQHALDRRLNVIGTAIAHIGMLITGLHDRNAGLFTDIIGGNHTWIGLEHRVLGTEGQYLEFTVGHKRHAQIVERDDLLDLIGIHLGEIHRDVAAIGMSHHGQTVIVGVRLDLLHLVDRKADV